MVEQANIWQQSDAHAKSNFSRAEIHRIGRELQKQTGQPNDRRKKRKVDEDESQCAQISNAVYKASANCTSHDYHD